MKHLITIALILVAISFSASAQQATMEIDPSNPSVYLFAAEGYGWAGQYSAVSGLILKVGAQEYNLSENVSGCKGLSAMLLSCFVNKTGFTLYYQSGSYEIRAVRIKM